MAFNLLGNKQTKNSHEKKMLDILLFIYTSASSTGFQLTVVVVAVNIVGVVIAGQRPVTKSNLWA